MTRTRVYIIDAVSGLSQTDTTVQRVLQNQVDIGNAAGSPLTDLLEQHILLAVDILNATKANNTAELNDANARWYANANQIADFLHAANPNSRQQAESRSMMKTQLDLTL